MKNLKVSYLALVCLASVSIGCTSSDTVVAETVYANEYITNQSEDNSNISISEYVKTLYQTTQYPELDAAVCNAFKTYEDNKNSPDIVFVYSGTKSDCTRFRDYLNYNYGYTIKMRVELMQVGSEYKVGFMDTLNADEAIAEYKNEAEKAKSIAASLKGNTQDETINNIINWVKTNAKYAYNVSDEEAFSYDYGIYSGKEVLCQGYADAVYQLCAMNGIKAEILNAIHTNNVVHAINRVYFSDIPRYVDTTLINSVSNILWSDTQLIDRYLS